MNHSSGSLLIELIPLALIILLVVGIYFYMRRRGYYANDSYSVIVRCRSGHLFTTIWIPMASFKAIRLGPVRFQHCPVGRHWTLVTIINASNLSGKQRAEAARNHDSNIP